jgi:hypothetical protein
MRPVQLLRYLLILAPTIGVVGGAVALAVRNWDAPIVLPEGFTASEARGKLVVVAVFDQLRGDYPERWREAYGSDGFEKLRTKGIYFANGRVPYAATSTGPGHAAISTGLPPSGSGIVENDWFVRGRELPVVCCKADRAYERVPAAQNPGPADGGLSPVRLLAPTVGDLLRKAKPESRVFALALKDRAAVLLGGKEPSGAYCFDTDDGEFHTSAFYRDRPHAFVDAFNASAAADRWAGKTWDRLGDTKTYDRLAGPDDQPGEGTMPDGSDRTFPHVLPPAGRPYYNELERSPFGNELVWEFAKAAIDGEKLGRGSEPDLLFLGFSATDLVGHKYGPDSHEALDTAIRADKLIAKMILELDASVGAGNYTLIVVADHGVCPLPEVARAKQPDASRIPPGEIVHGLDAALDGAFGTKNGQPGQWLEVDFRRTQPWVYLNRKQAEAVGVEYAAVEKYTAQWLSNRSGVAAAFARAKIQGPASNDALLRSVQLTFHPDRCGDVLVVPEKYCLLDGRPRGTNHGSPHDYDTHIPIFAYGAGVAAAGTKTEIVSILAIAPLIAKHLGIDPPTGCTEKPPY